MKNRPPLIAIDALGMNQPGGARSAILYLFDTLFRIRPDWRYVVFVSQAEPLYAHYPHVQQVVLPVAKGILARAVSQVITQLTVWRKKVDLVHFTKSQGGVVLNAKSIITFFDVTTLRVPEFHKPIAVWFWRYIQPSIARYSDAVVTLSQDAASDIHQFLRVPTGKIHVIPLASTIRLDKTPTDSDCKEVRDRYGLPDEYLLFVGALALKKNLSTLIEALGLLHEQGIHFPPLVLVGPKYQLSDASEIFSLIDRLGLSQRVLYTGPVPESDLGLIYAQAKIFLLPSIHEGFGIPCLEAMTCRVPIIASAASAIPEVVGDAGWLVEDFRSPKAWAESISSFLNDESARRELVAKGLRRVQDFSWTISAQKLVHLYEQLLGLNQA